jgi:hypothetical protein
MHELDLVSTATIMEIRDRPKVVVWAKRMKDAGRKAAESRRLKTAETEKWRLAGVKAAETGARNRVTEGRADLGPNRGGRRVQ